MTKQWVNKEAKRVNKAKAEALENLCAALSENGLTKEQVEHMKQWCLSNEGTYRLSETFYRGELLCLNKKDVLKCFDIFNKTQKQFQELWSLDNCNPERFLDSEPTEFDGDIIITDPCYVAKDEDWPAFYENPPMSKCMIRDTLYGDWGCTCWNTNTKEEIGQFCADAGLVGVFSREEVNKYNPEFEKEYGNRKWCWTLIENFKGKIQFIIKKTRFKYNGTWCNDFYVQVIGHGVNKTTNKPIDFIGAQTGL